MKNIYNKALVLGILFVLNTLTSNAQVQFVRVDSIKIIPTQPVKDDTIRIDLYVSAICVSQNFYLQHSLNGNNINIEGCYSISGATANTYFHDTLTVGKLNDGAYSIYFKGYMSFDYTQCSKDDSLADTLNFVILPPVKIPNIDVRSVCLYPNPANDILHVNVRAGVHVKEAIIYNAYGILLGSYKGSKPIDISAYPPGICFIQLNTDKGLYTQKFIKQ